MLSLSAAVNVVLVLVSLHFVRRYYLRLKSEQLPLPPIAINVTPGASGTSANQPWKIYELSKSIGSVYHLPRTAGLPFPISLIRNFVRQPPLIVINEAAATVELFQKRSEIFCDRPHWPMLYLLGRGDNVGFMNHGTKLNQARKLLHSEFNSLQVPKWDFLLEDGISSLMSDLSLGSDPRSILRRNIEQVVFRMTYGAGTTPEFLSLVEETTYHTGAALQPGRWMVNSIPLLAHIPPWFPYADFQRFAREARILFRKLVEGPFHQVKTEMILGVASPSFVRNRLSADNTQTEETRIMSTAGSLFSAGVDTTVVLLETIFLSLARNPALQERIYTELVDQGFDFKNLDLNVAAKLPIIEMVMKEGLRFNPPVPLLSRSPTGDSEYGGWSVPKGSWVMSNLWSIMHDATIFKDPHEFNPDRFVESHLTDPMSFAFGLGRRKCPGAFLGQRFVCMVLARTISLFKVVPTGDLCKPIEFQVKGLLSIPDEFNCEFIPRSPSTV